MLIISILFPKKAVMIPLSRSRLLTKEERIEEIAKMLAGSTVTQAARIQASQLLDK